MPGSGKLFKGKNKYGLCFASNGDQEKPPVTDEAQGHGDTLDIDPIDAAMMAR
jgi:hypothetical protein